MKQGHWHSNSAVEKTYRGSFHAPHRLFQNKMLFTKDDLLAIK